jgi:hypothetical protein
MVTIKCFINRTAAPPWSFLWYPRADLVHSLTNKRKLSCRGYWPKVLPVAMDTVIMYWSTAPRRHGHNKYHSVIREHRFRFRFLKTPSESYCHISRQNELIMSMECKGGANNNDVQLMIHESQVPKAFIELYCVCTYSDWSHITHYACLFYYKLNHMITFSFFSFLQTQVWAIYWALDI